MNKTRLLFSFILTVYTLCSLWGMYMLINEMQEYAMYKLQNAELMGFEGRVFDYKEWLPELFSHENSQQSKNLLQNAANSLDNAVGYGVLLVLNFVLFLSIIVVAIKQDKKKYLAVFWLTGTVIFLIVGILTPVLELAAVKQGLDIPLKIDSKWIGSYDFSRSFGGEMYFYFQMKSILGVIGSLIQKGNYVIGMTIFLFSVFLPLLKVVLSFRLLYVNSPKLTKIVHALAKWAMADVFLASIFIAYLSFNQMSTGVDMISDMLPGIYLFLCYCCLSIGFGTVFRLKKSSRELN